MVSILSALFFLAASALAFVFSTDSDIFNSSGWTSFSAVPDTEIVGFSWGTIIFVHLQLITPVLQRN
jgi:hypothetical protein